MESGEKPYELPHMGRMVEAALRLRGIGHQELAHLAGISRQYAWLLQGKASIPLPMLARISVAIGVNLVAEVAAVLPIPPDGGDGRGQGLESVAEALRGLADTLTRLASESRRKEGH